MVLQLEIFKIALFILVLAFTWHLPIIQLLYGMVATRAIVYIVTIVTIGRNVGYTWDMQLRDVMPSVITAIIMVAIAFPIQYFITNIYRLFATQICVCAAFYLTVNRFLQREIMDEMIRTLSKIGK